MPLTLESVESQGEAMCGDVFVTPIGVLGGSSHLVSG